MEVNLKQLLSSRQKRRLNHKGLTEAAVLVPIFYKQEEYHILFTLRSNSLAHHSGQVSFPGGTYSESDSNLLDTALRESWEEIRLNPEDVDVVGELDDTQTTTSGFIITPYVAFIPHPHKFTPNPHEIIEIFDIPVSALLNEANFRQENQIMDGKAFNEYFYEYNGRVIWGATARILKQLLDIFQSAV